MNKAAIHEIMELQKRFGIEPFMTEQGWTEFWRLVLEQEEQEIEKSA